MSPLVSFVVFGLALASCLCEEETQISGNRKARDSYLDAYKASHSGAVKVVKSEREYNPNVEGVHPGYPTAPQSRPEFPYPSAPSGPQYGLPVKAVYGPPSHSYGPPPLQIYGTSAIQHISAMPHAMLGILDKVKLFKLDLYTIGKIVLKLVIFKKIVSLIAILCLLLFIPSLKQPNSNDDGGNEGASVEMDSDEDMMMKRSFAPASGNASIDNVTAFVLEAIENFHQGRTGGCESVYCKTESVLGKVDKKMSYKKLATLYAKDFQ